MQIFSGGYCGWIIKCLVSPFRKGAFKSYTFGIEAEQVVLSGEALIRHFMPKPKAAPAHLDHGLRGRKSCDRSA